MQTPRERVLARLRSSLAEGRSLLATGAGSGLVGAAAAAGGADLLVVYSSGRYRRAGHGSLSALLPFGNANAIVAELAPEIVGAAGEVPTIAGVCGTDPFCDLDDFVRHLRSLGIAGIQNFPTIGLFDDAFRDDLEATGISFEREVESMRAAQRAGLFTCAFVTSAEDARRMALVGVDAVAPLLGVTRSSDRDDALADAARKVQTIAEAASEVRDDLLVLFHGGPAATVDDVRRVLEQAPAAHGFIAASSVERQPVRDAVVDAVRAFVGIHRGGAPDPARGPDFDQPPPELPIELTPRNLAAYLRDREIVPHGRDVEVEELGGGLSNVILRWRSGGESGVVKQSRPRLRVADVWLSDVRRVLNERDAIAFLAPRLRTGDVPQITFSDDETLAFGMSAIADGPLLWKPELLEGRLDPERARQAGVLLREIHDSTRDDPAVAARFVARPLLDQNRLDPWYRAAALAHPDLEQAFEYAIERLLAVRHVLVHGDFVPKNIFLADDRLILLDFEVAHFGNPGYDVATFVNHMLLKGFRFGQHRRAFCDLAETMWAAYANRGSDREAELVEQETLVQLGALMLARVDGKSKVEYLVGEPAADDARAFGRWLLRRRPPSLRGVFDRYLATPERR